MRSLTPWTRAAAAAALLAALALAAGCSGRGGVAVKGRVSLDGQPVDYGSITLLPLEGQKVKTGSLVQKGEFSIPSRDGPQRGKYRVEFRWPRPTGQKIRNGDTGEVMAFTAEAFPPTFNTDSTLTADIQSGVNDLDFTTLKSR